MNTSYLLGEYFKTALWASVDENDVPLDRNYSIENVDEASIMHAAEEIEQFMAKAKALIGDQLYKYRQGALMHDFWLTRNGHGAGFWDGDYSEVVDGREVGDILSELAHSFGLCGLEVRDGKVVLLCVD